jgi:hypothetical protein
LARRSIHRGAVSGFAESDVIDLFALPQSRPHC